MGKKYQPSGYQIINLNLTGKTSGTPFDAETEDEKILLNIFQKILHQEIQTKPILLSVILTGYTFLGFPILSPTGINISDVRYDGLNIDSVVSLRIMATVDNQLEYVLIDE